MALATRGLQGKLLAGRRGEEPRPRLAHSRVPGQSSAMARDKGVSGHSRVPGTRRQHSSSSQVQVFGEGNTQKPGNGDVRWAGLEVATVLRVYAQGWERIRALTGHLQNRQCPPGGGRGRRCWSPGGFGGTDPRFGPRRLLNPATPTPGSCTQPHSVLQSGNSSGSEQLTLLYLP